MRYVLKVDYKGEKPIYKPPHKAQIICETVEYNWYGQGSNRLTIEHEMDELPEGKLFDLAEVLDSPTGARIDILSAELYCDEPPTYHTAIAKRQNEWWKQRSPNLRREF
jgi:hypothetical protein